MLAQLHHIDSLPTGCYSMAASSKLYLQHIEFAAGSVGKRVAVVVVVVEDGCLWADAAGFGNWALVCWYPNCLFVFFKHGIWRKFGLKGWEKRLASHAFGYKISLKDDI